MTQDGTRNQAEHWDGRYRAGDAPWDTGAPSTELMRVVAEEGIQPCRAVELGCGTGASALWLARQGFDVTAIDVSALAIGQARERARGAGVRFAVGDVLDTPDLGGPFDFLFDRGCYHAVRRVDVKRYLATVARNMSPGAAGLILAGNARERRSPGPPVVTEDELRAEIGSVCGIVWLREFRFDARPGSGENFLGWSCFVRTE